MKRKLICSVLLTSLLAVGCSEDFLDPVRNDTVLTTADISDYVDVNPALVDGSLEGIYSYMITPRGVLGAAANRHYDFGHKSLDIWSDMVCGDMALSANSYGWYQDTANMIVTVDYTQEENRIIWQYLYKVVSLSNLVINSLGGNDAVQETDQTRHAMGQAKALRGYAYFYLTQFFQKTYNPEESILPYTDGETSIPSKVPASQIYDLIISDLTESIDLLGDFTRENKHQIDKSVAQGLLAYTYAAMGENTQAKALCDQIIASGYPLTTTAQLSYPGAGSGFNDVTTPSWMWGYDITEAMGQQLINWWGQVDYYTFSYAAAGDKKAMDNNLYSNFPTNDVRRSQFSTVTSRLLMPTNKFFDPGRTASGQQVITTDYIFMRVDEFYLLGAECAAKAGDEAGAKTLMIQLLTGRLGGATNAQNYINPLSGQALRDAIYLQTRLELWGEGKSYFAMKRNQATVTRGTNHVFRPGASFQYNSDEISFQIPQYEMNNNPAITSQN
ncbi:RagB/SusD family nutrient uptake outer membrane protein [Flavobacterium silvaticum]|uniref:RagB/SusD family nutrient uptake outer membrane protein n=1 Tax=Flavobacterium silvaticum TaxID=1852020 RepID=A0A972FIM5_9FLAO|nr:RagB/SusD family nutrient uptake outer membrane protein [Flavobacterium silvaticum]NMH26709.1 RagB/SusD family nutrient uptake outer membrane protein [Flavobacterium silvaticum]